MNADDAQLLLRFDAYRVLERSSRKARRIRIEIRGANEVRLVIPRWASRREAHAFLESRQDWVRRKLEEARLRAPVLSAVTRRLRWDNTDMLPLQGIEIPLRVSAQVGRSVAVRFDSEAIYVLAPPARLADAARLELALRRALKERARQVATALLNEEAARLGVSWTALSLRDPRSLWGSCGHQGKIMLSWRLLLTPPDVFRYVVIHELCHLRYRSHGPRFWGLVSRQMPGYEVHRAWLRGQGAALHRLRLA